MGQSCDGFRAKFEKHKINIMEGKRLTVSQNGTTDEVDCAVHSNHIWVKCVLDKDHIQSQIHNKTVNVVNCARTEFVFVSDKRIFTSCRH